MKRATSPSGAPDTVWKFTDGDGSFSLENPGQFSRLYFPLANEAGMLSNITPRLKGSIKIGHDAFLTLPVSSEDLHTSKVNRNFWILKKGAAPWSASGVAKNKTGFTEKTRVEAGLLWHRLLRQNRTLGLEARTLNFVPSSGEKVEIMIVRVANTGKKPAAIEAVAAIPLYARSADNLRDHRHVTSLLHRIELDRHGVLVSPTMTFDERGHRINTLTYAVLGFDDRGGAPRHFYPTVENFIGEGGSFEFPHSLFKNENPPWNARSIQGKEAMGAFRFAPRTLKSGEVASYVLVLGIAEKRSEIAFWKRRFGDLKTATAAHESTQKHWLTTTRSVLVKTGNPVFDGWVRWVGVQPVFRKLFGCSFLPDFDYGRGGRGWRDLWQDCLALLLTEPHKTRPMILHNFGGVRIDGSNATIISAGDYGFVADRNRITRVWMDHGVWPLVTTDLYIHQTGDLPVLLKKAPYFRDPQLHRARLIDHDWKESDGMVLKDRRGKNYEGTLFEHLLVQHLVQFFNTGAHNHIRLENADWNDGLDMAAEHGESVAFTTFYAGNLRRLAELAQKLTETNGIRGLRVLKELLVLLDGRGARRPNYGSASYRQWVLQRYFRAAQPAPSGQTVEVPVADLVRDLRAKADSLGSGVRDREWVRTRSGHEFFNGYYDNKARRVEGDHGKTVRMTLTGQVFPVMSGVATDAQVRSVIRSVRKFLKDPVHRGIRLNTDFGAIQPDLGRAFSFAYGEKENGAFFNHMQVMYSNALYRRGFAAEGWEVLKNIHRMCVNTSQSRIYPGLPEYFNSEGRGMYHYLTGSASWCFMTLLVESLGIRGDYGNLRISPRLMADQFGPDKKITVGFSFADRKIRVEYHNPSGAAFPNYRIASALLGPARLDASGPGSREILVPRKTLAALSKNGVHPLRITLGA